MKHRISVIELRHVFTRANNNFVANNYYQARNLRSCDYSTTNLGTNPSIFLRKCISLDYVYLCSFGHGRFCVMRKLREIKQLRCYIICLLEILHNNPSLISMRWNKNCIWFQKLELLLILQNFDLKNSHILLFTLFISKQFHYYIRTICVISFFSISVESHWYISYSLFIFSKISRFLHFQKKSVSRLFQ